MLQPRAILNRLIAWWPGWSRLTVRRLGAWLRRTVPTLLLPSGWAFITWSMFLWSPRAWGASVGIYLVFSALMPVIADYLAAKAVAKRNVDR